MRSQACLEGAERVAQRVVAERAARFARRPITTGQEAVELLLAQAHDPDVDHWSRAIRDRMTNEARADFLLILDEAIAFAEAREARAAPDPVEEPASL